MSNKTIMEELKALVSTVSSDAILDLRSGRAAIAIFHDAKEKVHLTVGSIFFADKEYLEKFGPRGTLDLLIDEELHELPPDWLDALQAEVEDGELAKHWPVIFELLELGLKAKAEEFRELLLTIDLAPAVEDAMVDAKNSQS